MPKISQSIYLNNFYIHSKTGRYYSKALYYFSLFTFLRKHFLASVVKLDQTLSDEWFWWASNSRECKVIHHVALLLSCAPLSPPPSSLCSPAISPPFCPGYAPAAALLLSSLSFYSPPSCFPLWLWLDLWSYPPLGIIRRKRLFKWGCCC